MTHHPHHHPTNTSGDPIESRALEFVRALDPKLLTHGSLCGARQNEFCPGDNVLAQAKQQATAVEVATASLEHFLGKRLDLAEAAAGQGGAGRWVVATVVGRSARAVDWAVNQHSSLAALSAAGELRLVALAADKHVAERLSARGVAAFDTEEALSLLNHDPLLLRQRLLASLLRSGAAAALIADSHVRWLRSPGKHRRGRGEEGSEVNSTCTTVAPPETPLTPPLARPTRPPSSNPTCPFPAELLWTGRSSFALVRHPLRLEGYGVPRDAALLVPVLAVVGSPGGRRALAAVRRASRSAPVAAAERAESPSWEAAAAALGLAESEWRADHLLQGCVVTACKMMAKEHQGASSRALWARPRRSGVPWRQRRRRWRRRCLMAFGRCQSRPKGSGRPRPG